MLDTIRAVVREGGIRRLVRLSKATMKGKYYSLRYPSKLDAGKRVKVTGRLIIKGGGTVKMGDFVSIRGDFGQPVGFNVGSGATCSIGSGTFINHGGYFAVAHEVEVGQDCFIGPELSVYDRNGHQREVIETDEGVIVGDDVWIGAGTTLLAGTEIGSGAIVGAGSVVTKDVPENTLVAGDPAEKIRDVPALKER